MLVTRLSGSISHVSTQQHQSQAQLPSGNKGCSSPPKEAHINSQHSPLLTAPHPPPSSEARVLPPCPAGLSLQSPQEWPGASTTSSSGPRTPQPHPTAQSRSRSGWMRTWKAGPLLGVLVPTAPHQVHHLLGLPWPLVGDRVQGGPQACSHSDDDVHHVEACERRASCASAGGQGRGGWAGGGPLGALTNAWGVNRLQVHFRF